MEKVRFLVKNENVEAFEAALEELMIDDYQVRESDFYTRFTIDCESDGEAYALNLIIDNL